MDPLERRDLIENEENEINVNEDTIEGENVTNGSEQIGNQGNTYMENTY